MKYEWKKNEKELYLPKTTPVLVTVPEHKYFMLKGNGDPNGKEFSEGIGILYSLSYAIKMMPKKGIVPDGYFEYAVFPLEALWDKTEEGKAVDKLVKNELIYTMMIRQPKFVTDQTAEQALEMVKKKKPHPLLDRVTFESVSDGLSVQMLHIGPYDNEPESFYKMEGFCKQNQLKRTTDIHREIYISNARKVLPALLKTVLRFGVEKTVLRYSVEKSENDD